MKRKSEKGASSTPSKKFKKMARKPKSPSPSSSDHNEEKSADEEEEAQLEGTPQGNTPPRSPTPTEVLDDKVSTPPHSPPKTIVLVSVTSLHPSPPKTTVQVSDAPIPPIPTTQPTSTSPPPPPISTTPITTTPLPPHIISQVIVTTTPIITSTTTKPLVNVNVSDTEEFTRNDPPVTTEHISPTPSNEFAPILRGDNFEFDSTYYIPYRIPSEDDEAAPATK